MIICYCSAFLLICYLKLPIYGMEFYILDLLLTLYSTFLLSFGNMDRERDEQETNGCSDSGRFSIGSHCHSYIGLLSCAAGSDET